MANEAVTKDNVNSSNKLRQMVLVAVMAAAICVVAPFTVPLPFTAIPITFANLMIYIAVFALGWKRGTLSCIIYLMIGMIGVPVFSGFSGGFGKFAGPTGGYIIGYVLQALAAGIIVDAVWNSSLKRPLKAALYMLALLLGQIICYIFGTAWYMIQQELTFTVAATVSALSACVIPFIPGDVIKIIIAIIIGTPLRSTLRSNQLV